MQDLHPIFTWYVYFLFIITDLCKLLQLYVTYFQIYVLFGESNKYFSNMHFRFMLKNKRKLQIYAKIK